MSDREEVSTDQATQPPRPLARKVLIVLSLALAPLGILAALLSVASYVDARQLRMLAVEDRALDLAEEVNRLTEVDNRFLRTLAVRFEDIRNRTRCEESLGRIVAARPLFAEISIRSLDGTEICSSPQEYGRLLQSDWERAERLLGSGERQSTLFFGENGQTLVYALRNGDGADTAGSQIFAVIPMAEMRGRLSRLERPAGSTVSVQLSETPQGESPEPVRTESSSSGSYAVLAPTRLAGLNIRYEEEISTLPPRRAVSIILPPLMWLAALLIAWITLRKLVLKPLKTMRQGLEERTATGNASPLAPRVGDTLEFLTFASAFDTLAAKQRQNRRNLERSLEAQQRLVREVHHRVKNNLQIVTSLLSIKGRDTGNDAERGVYGAIQMRVEALALVHRWLYADDPNRGVDLCALVNDLMANLETGIESVYNLEAQFKTKLDGAFVGQDTAVPLAFLITELVASEARGHERALPLEAVLELRTAGEFLDMTLSGPTLTGADVVGDASTATSRIIVGMARQLRAELQFDEEDRAYRLRFPSGKASCGKDEDEAADRD